MNAPDRKLIAIDLDGTLLTRDKKISPRTKRVLEEARNAGHHVVIATGRPPRSALDYYQELSLHTPMVNFNGALVHHAKDEAWGHHHFPLDRTTALTIIEACEKFGVENVMVEIKDDFYLKHEDDEMVKILCAGAPALGVGHIPHLLRDDPTAVLIKPQAHSVPQLRAHLQEHHADLIEHRHWGAPWNVIEVIKSGVTKASGLQVIAGSLGVPRENIIAFGDEDNDFEMIEYAGHGVAMGNAHPKLKELANEITRTNDEDGIAHVLERLL
ncbi:MAG TPA: Cof-type HAD-IIB family hydrolase [Bacilli bacterium]|nr:Cof-type HAD-IIB family hydrolase [Bacilli bacterium]